MLPQNLIRQKNMPNNTLPIFPGTSFLAPCNVLLLQKAFDAAARHDKIDLIQAIMQEQRSHFFSNEAFGFAFQDAAVLGKQNAMKAIMSLKEFNRIPYSIEDLEFDKRYSLSDTFYATIAYGQRDSSRLLLKNKRFLSLMIKDSLKEVAKYAFIGGLSLFALGTSLRFSNMPLKYIDGNYGLLVGVIYGIAKEIFQAYKTIKTLTSEPTQDLHKIRHDFIYLTEKNDLRNFDISFLDLLKN